MVSYYNLQSFASSEPELFLHVYLSFSFVFYFAVFLIRNSLWNITRVIFVVSRHEFLHLVAWKGMEGALN